MEAAFHLLSLQLGEEEEQWDRAVEALETVMPGETAFLPESLAWSGAMSGRVFARLIGLAQARDINVVTTLNLAGDLIEDLPGAVAGERYNALVIFTRHGAVHVPQAKVIPHAFEMDRRIAGPNIGVSPYTRLNRVRLDWQDDLYTVRFFVSSDLTLLRRFSPAELACDLLVCLGGFVAGAERHAARLLGLALDAGVARTAMLVNPWHEPLPPRGRPLAARVEDVLDAVRRRRPGGAWPTPRAFSSAVHTYPDARARDFAATCRLRDRKSRIPVPGSLARAPATLGSYPVTVVM